ncbi:DUF3311 domain-containing protein [Streptomyces sp. NPDC046821]|uniref:DUF3311 domain-containing protein n=1 Tax=Streptomyces sp. NPDC046821 TaxID=3154702 RepID=UPI0033CCB8C4
MTEERPLKTRHMMDRQAPVRANAARTAARLCLAAAFIGPLLAPLSMRTEPRLLGWPFFYWYQLAWVPLGAALLVGAMAFRRLGRRQESPVNQSAHQGNSP